MENRTEWPLKHVQPPRVSFRHQLSKSSADAPSLRVQWFYAIDRPVRKSKKGSLEAKKSKSFKPFSVEDSDRIEAAYQNTEDTDGQSETIRVNEDYLYAVNVISREVFPIYWDGPVFRILRGTWFYARGDKLYPCEENLAIQVEEGYLNICPYREKVEEKDDHSMSAQGKTWALLGKYTGAFIEYSGDRSARMHFGGFYRNVSTKLFTKMSYSSNHRSDKLIRGYDISSSTITDAKSTTSSTVDDLSSSSTLVNDSSEPNELLSPSLTEPASEIPTSTDASHLKSSPDREINHLILCCHGIGQKMGERVETVNFVRDINEFRKTLKKTFNASPDLQALYPNFKGGGNGIQCLPLLWRQDIHFGMARDNKSDISEEEESDSFDVSKDLALDDLSEDPNPTLESINIPTVVGLRSIISDVLLDVLLYCQPKYRERILVAVVKRLNRLYRLYVKHNPSFQGQVSLLGHSLGALILFDIVRFQGNIRYPRLQLDFPVNNFFTLGSPLGLFQMLNGKRIAGQIPRSTITRSVSYSESNFDSSVSVLSCKNFYNIFHPTDPISYRVEPLIVKKMAHLKPQSIPHFRPLSHDSSSGVGHRLADGALNVLSGLRSGIANTLILKSLSYASVFNEATSNQKVHVVEEGNQAYQIDERMYRLNKTGRVDFMLQEGSLDTSYSYVSAMNAHSNYWKNADLAHFILTQLL
ncbi:phospholipase [Schizosaccharomyces cryophilus OY26]|uniref:Phospholipase n=1 Tax=Schizosaccharomyces cryophilus (strain OY26 / ATCC MYA-4695 / CBS 11777 / NBRC 106824 / NRRL Y48691) TaxID=653667 RepID=S9VSS5_SCHCR|nr:phospholipase [Schizosaccharomyces cryophilus OY26]EPY50938.1 phospholipase [Schizosaccharomyces cryophilus OY26]